MKKSIHVSLALLALLTGVAIAPAQQPIDPRVADLVRTGQVRVAMFPPQFTKNTATGELGGWGLELARALGARLGIEAATILKPGPDGVLECLKADLCDAGFLVNSPMWADVVDFSHPFLEQEFTFLIPAGSAIRRVADVDRPEVRVAVVRNHGSTLALARILKQAKTVSADTLDGAFALLRDGQADAFASTRPQLLDDSTRLPGSIVLEDRYGVNFSVLAVPKNRAGRLAYVNEFIQEAKMSGLLRSAIIEHAGWRGVRVVSP
jgi:polar amino acid transport system substrate-binding protein